MKKLLILSILSINLSYADMASFDIENLQMNYNAAMGTIETGTSQIIFEDKQHNFNNDQLEIRKAIDHLVIENNLFVIPLHYGFFKPVESMSLNITQAQLSQSMFLISSNSLDFSTEIATTSVPSFTISSNIPSGYTSTGKFVDQLIASLNLSITSITTQMKTSSAKDIIKNVSLQVVNGELSVNAAVESWTNYNISIAGFVTNDKINKVVKIELSNVSFGIIPGRAIIASIIRNLQSSRIAMNKNTISIFY